MSESTGRPANPADARSGIDELAERLGHHTTWPGGTRDVEWIQTHISHVFLTEDRVYKLHKDVSLPFLDFGSRALRNADCFREVVLNRRLAPDVYLGMAPVRVRGDQAEIGPLHQEPDDTDSEYVVVMRRLANGGDALTMLEQGHLEHAHLEAVADRLQRFHATQGLGVPAPWSETEWLDRIESPILACLESLSESRILPGTRLTKLASSVQDRLSSLRPRFEKRRQAGRAVDGHGDLHLDHIWFEEAASEPAIIDCIEFSDDLRRIDIASEVAFLAMDLLYRDRTDLAESFLHAYASRSDDYDLYATVDFFAAYRALVRAKVAAIAAGQPTIAAAQRDQARTSAERHVELAERLLAVPEPGELILLCGTVGSGKSTVARELAHSGRGVPIASDRVRKAMAGLEATTHTENATDEGIYRTEQSEAVYAALLERAGSVVEGGRSAILDASFAKRSHRDAARHWAAERGLAIRLIEVRCDPDLALSRLRERARIGADPSDAGPDFLAVSQARFEPPDEWPAADRQVVWSSDSVSSRSD